MDIPVITGPGRYATWVVPDNVVRPRRETLRLKAANVLRHISNRLDPPIQINRTKDKGWTVATDGSSVLTDAAKVDQMRALLDQLTGVQ